MTTDDPRPTSDDARPASDDAYPGTVDTRPPPYRPGPAPFALVLGVLGLLVAGVVLLAEVAEVGVPWSALGPWTVVAGGLLVVLVGLLGLRGDRRRE